MAPNTVVVLGGGTGGLVAAHLLRASLDPADRVVLVEREPVHQFAPSLLWVMAGMRRRERITTDTRRLRRRGIEVTEASVSGIETAAQRVQTSQGALGYDRLVIALGAELAPGELAGFAEDAHNLYTIAGAESAHAALARIERGRVAVIVSRLPFKCPAAPYEAAFLAEALLRRRGVRAQVTVDLYTPEPLPMPTAGEAVGQAVAGMLGARGIGFHPNSRIEAIDPSRHELQFADGARAEYDLLLGVPAHRAPEVLAASGLAAQSGFVPVDRHTLATGAQGVLAIGDATAIPLADGKFMLPKAGVFAHAQAKVVAKRVVSELAGSTPEAVFDGHGACFVELGDGAAGYASGDFYAEGGPKVRMRHPRRHWHLAKVGFERYWMRRWA